MTARIAAITAIVIATLAVLCWLRADSSFDIRTVLLPFLSGQDVSLYDWGGLAIVILGVWGLVRLYRNTAHANGSNRTSDVRGLDEDLNSEAVVEEDED